MEREKGHTFRKFAYLEVILTWSIIFIFRLILIRFFLWIYCDKVSSYYQRHVSCIIHLSVMVFYLNLIAVKLVREEAFADLLRSYHAAPGVARLSANGSMGNIKRVKCNLSITLIWAPDRKATSLSSEKVLMDYHLRAPSVFAKQRDLSLLKCWSQFKQSSNVIYWKNIYISFFTYLILIASSYTGYFCQCARE